MIKSLILFKDLKSKEVFRQFYLTQFLPRVKNISGVIGIRITNYLQQIGQDLIPIIDRLEFMIELHFESKQELSRVVETTEYQELLKLIDEKSPREIIYLLGHQTTYNDKQKFLLLPRW
ncbi:hypothetical protein [Shimazuella alba]|uniref:DUF1330 domain-containing protein n=1 Tax=Shimazuella alba TaxID=2690964 RepID=A0A6I4VQD0_9BACL|nr:hypothetical protein [Shimazuella alba]MXQ52166.1 hypothetical protein [Shimazuella alba]